MEQENLRSELIKIQGKLKENFDEHLKNEFNLLLANYVGIKDVLDKRDVLIEKSTYQNFWTKCLLSLEKMEDMRDIFEFSNKTHEKISLIKKMKVSYESDYWCSVVIHLNKNPYIENEILSRKFNVVNGESQTSKINWIDAVDCELFHFFDEGETDLELFDILYDIYVNAIEYYFEI